MLSEKQELVLMELFQKRQDELTEKVFIKIGNRLKEIGELKPSDIYKIDKLTLYGTVPEDITKEINKVMKLNITDMYTAITLLAKSEYLEAYKIFHSQKMIRENTNQMVHGMAAITANKLTNLANTTIIDQAYKKAVDTAVHAIATGTVDYQSELQQTLKNLGMGGLRVRYESGYERRLDSALRMNILDAFKELQIQINQDLGKQYGSDGVEISAHSLCAPDHQDIQGKQFTYEQFERLQSELPFEDVEGIKYSALRRTIGRWNCRHYISNIIVGVSKPQKTNEELQEIKNNSNRTFECRDNEYTTYEATQIMRVLESKIRSCKETRILAKSAGNVELEGKMKKKIATLTAQYNELISVAGLTSQLKMRARVSGYKR